MTVSALHKILTQIEAENEVKKLSIADKVKLIDDVITREVEWADESTEDLQNAWVDVKHYINEFVNYKYKRR
tara:strand:+ start:261 stop:476 length:216 start_codon:yes stop_codon:yes gene_type:complete